MHTHRPVFEQLASEWDSLQSPQRSERLRQLLSSLEPVHGAGSILEVGTGTGALIPLLRERSPSARLVSIDLAHAMLVQAQKRAGAAGLVQADVHRLAFRRCFDVVICHNSFPHFTDKPAALAELRRVLCPGGCLIVLHDTCREKVNAIHQNARAAALHHDLLPTGEEMQALLSCSGFVEIRVQDAQDRYIATARAMN